MATSVTATLSSGIAVTAAVNTRPTGVCSDGSVTLNGGDVIRGDVPSGGTEDVDVLNTANDAIGSVESEGLVRVANAVLTNSNGSYNDTVKAEGTKVLADISFTDSDGSVSSVPAQTDIVATPCPDCHTIPTPILDTYASAAVAYSVRKLRTAYAGNCMEVRRSSDNTLANIGFDGDGKLDEAALLAHVGAGDGFVRTWYDQSGNTRDIVQTTNANQPKIVDTGAIIVKGAKDTLPTVRFTNSQWLRNTTFGAIASPITYAFVYGTLDTTSNCIISSGTNFNMVVFQETSHVLYTGDGNTGYISYNRPQPVPFWHEFFVHNGASSKSYGNGVIWVSGNGFTGGTNGFTIGAFFNNTYPLNGVVSEVIAWPSNQDANQAAITANQNTFFEIYEA